LLQNIKYRLGGLFILAVGAAIGWYFLYEPLQAAKAGAPEVRYSLKAFFIVPFCMVFGLAFAVFGTSLDYRDAERNTLKPLGWALFAVVVIVTAAGFWWFKEQFAALGYVDM